MNPRRRWACTALAALLCGPALGQGPSFRTIGWDDLLPKDWDPWADFRQGDLKGIDMTRLSDDDPRAAAALQRLRKVWDEAPLNMAMDGQSVRVPGYVVPLDPGAQGLRELLLVPHYGACIHTPPPASNQIIHVRLDKPNKSLSTMDTVWISGRLTARRATTVHGSSGYALEGVRVERYTATQR
ncbi:DUF3299 domain-containing protein [Aquincola sp. MAHUQ-54]|uniref:DUF3299 domain-containing protein n=1 Tax=Aquincola agrisoli TaxID=3119538 RepID=A0AAW9Q7U5_9BURK